MQYAAIFNRNSNAIDHIWVISYDKKTRDFLVLDKVYVEIIDNNGVCS